MSEVAGLRDWAPLEWSGIDPDTREILDRVTIDREDGGTVVVTDAPSSTFLLRLEPHELAQRSLTSTLVQRLSEFYCVSCRKLLDAGVCSECDRDRGKRLKRTIALLEEDPEWQ